MHHGGMWRRYLTPVIWLIVPIMAMNIVLAARLPAAFQPDVFWADIPPLLAWPENRFRLLLFALMAVLPISGSALGWCLFALGSTLYVASWAALILAPDSGWSTSLPGFTAGAWTPAVWIVGIGLIAGPPHFSRHRAWKTAYWLLAAGFLAAHSSHAALIWFRLN